MSSTTKIDGVVARGGDVPQVDPTRLTIVGLDVPDSDEYYWAWCPRASEPADEEMVASFRATNEVIDPIKVRRDGAGSVVLDGRRRTKAARIVWLEQQKAGVEPKNRILVRFIVAATNNDDAARVNRQGNDGRKDYTAIQKAQQIAHFAKHMRGTQDEIAAKLGVTAGTIRNLSAILECAPKVQAAIEAGTIAYSHAPSFAKLDRTEQAKRLDEMIAKGATKGARATKAVKTGDTAPIVKMRSRKFLERFRDAYRAKAGDRESRTLMLINFFLGDDQALAGTSLYAEAIAAAQGKKRKGGVS